MRCRCRHEFVLPALAEDSAALSCPGCGGKSSATRTRCEYCGIPLKSVRCPRCFALAFAGAAHCAECGSALTAPARAYQEDGSAAMRCPRCRAALVASMVSDTLVDCCEGCGGLWLDHEVLERMLDDERRRPTVEVALGRLPPAPLVVDSRKVVYVPCPECATLMNRKNFANRSGVIVDVCPAHGIWFDQGELARIIGFVRSGGWDRALEIERRAATQAPPPAGTLPVGKEGSAYASINAALIDVIAQLFD
jgi:Zn-finger nucleic acid-binding protein